MCGTIVGVTCNYVIVGVAPLTSPRDGCGTCVEPQYMIGVYKREQEVGHHSPDETFLRTLLARDRVSGLTYLRTLEMYKCRNNYRHNTIP